MIIGSNNIIREHVNHCYCGFSGVVPDGTYEVCSRTTGQASAGKCETIFRHLKKKKKRVTRYNNLLIFQRATVPGHGRWTSCGRCVVSMCTWIPTLASVWTLWATHWPLWLEKRTMMTSQTSTLSTWPTCQTRTRVTACLHPYTWSVISLAVVINISVVKCFICVKCLFDMFFLYLWCHFCVQCCKRVVGLNDSLHMQYYHNIIKQRQ